MAVTREGTPFELAIVRSERDPLFTKSQIEAVIRSSDNVAVLDQTVVAVMAGTAEEVESGVARISKALQERQANLALEIHPEPYKKRLKTLANKVTRGDLHVSRRSGLEAADRDDLYRLYREMKEQAWKAQQRVEILEKELTRTRLQLEMERAENASLKKVQEKKRRVF